VIAGCGGQEIQPAEIHFLRQGEAPRKADIPPGAGGQIVLQSGCLACHRVGGEGNDGPGPALTDVGARLTKRQIRRALRAPTAPMPSYRDLPRAALDELVGYLSGLGR
jgi:ubiquinol-cytochrome c reductase cytochrome b subunit/menaquinol-cytochrome c reductase cytochrome b/c subunit